MTAGDQSMQRHSAAKSPLYDPPPSLSHNNFDFSIDFMGSTDAPADPAARPSLT